MELPSPTGRDPQFLWTSQRQYTYDRMRQAGHWLYTGLLACAQMTGTPQQRYADSGLFGAWAFQVTGDVTLARKAWALWLKITDYGTGWPGANTVREGFGERVLVLDWIWPALTEEEKVKAITALKRWGDFVLAKGTPDYVGDVGRADSDQGTGSYFGLAALDLFDVPENFTKGTWLNATTRSGLPIGGLDPTGEGTLRDLLLSWVLKSGGGEWIESSEYNQGTEQLLMLLFASLETRTPGHFPEVEAWLMPAATWSAQDPTPNRLGYNQWGDVEGDKKRGDLVYKHWKRDAMLAGLSGDGVLQKLVRDVEAEQEPALRASIHLIARAALLWNFERTPALAYPWTLERVAVSNDVGHYAIKSPDTLAVLAAPPTLRVHHERTQTPSMKLWREGEWALNHPLGYGPIPVSSLAVNGVLLAGLYCMDDRGGARVESGADWWALTGSTQGPYYGAYYNPPPPFVTKAERSTVYWREGVFDVFLVRDHVIAADPTKLAKFDRYRAADQATIRAALARTGGTVKEFIFHAPGPPVLELGRIKWTTALGKEVTLQHVAPINPARSVSNEAAFLTAGFPASELTGKHIRIWPATVQDEDEVVTAVFVGNGPTPAVEVTPKGIAVGSKVVSFLDGRIVVKAACTCPD